LILVASGAMILLLGAAASLLRPLRRLDEPAGAADGAAAAAPVPSPSTQ
jgi:hypothetical protein